MTTVRYGAGGAIIQEIKEVQPVEKVKKKQEPLQELIETIQNEEDGFDEEHGDEE